jgi:hypothetical protein
MIIPIATALPRLLAEGEVENFPLHYQIACIVFTGIFLWTFSIARDPRGWRRLYQTKFARKDEFSVNKNKRIDEAIKKWGILVAMFFLVVDVALFVSGITYSARSKKHSWTNDERFHAIDVQKASGPRR